MSNDMGGCKDTTRRADPNQPGEVDDALLALDLAPRLGFGVALKMLTAFGDAATVLSSSPAQLSRQLGITSSRSAACVASLREGAQRCDRERDAMARIGCSLVDFHSPHYPAQDDSRSAVAPARTRVPSRECTRHSRGMYRDRGIPASEFVRSATSRTVCRLLRGGGFPRRFRWGQGNRWGGPSWGTCTRAADMRDSGQWTRLPLSS